MPSLIFVSPLSRDFTGKDSSQCFKFNTFPLQMKSEENNGQDQQEKLCSISVNSLSILSNEQIVLLPACFRSETRITNWWSLNLKHAGHSTWNTFNPNLPRRISSPTFDADVVVIRCQSALLCRNMFTFFCNMPRDPYCVDSFSETREMIGFKFQHKVR